MIMVTPPCGVLPTRLSDIPAPVKDTQWADMWRMSTAMEQGEGLFPTAADLVSTWLPGSDARGSGGLLNSGSDDHCMSVTALLFPGQGSQSPGMGRDLADRFPEASAIFEMADGTLGFPLSRLCFEGPAEDLRRTENTQAAILTTSVATLAVLRARGLQPGFVAGHSLGEYSALVCAGAVRFEDALRLVRLRGRLMQEAVPDGVGAMAALMGIDAKTAQSVCTEVADGQVVSPANLNSASQIVIAGHADAVGRAVERAREVGARRAVILDVSAPFHCELMAPAGRALAPALSKVRFTDLSMPLVNNWQARTILSADEAREGLRQQIPNPVLWERSVRHLISRNVERFVEVGPGRVLTGLMRSIDRSVHCRSTHDLAAVEAITT